MPYVQLPGEDVAIYYKIQGAAGQRDLDREKPTLLYIHAVLLDQDCWSKQFEDTRLRRRFNSVSMDMRSHGKTKNTIAPNYDTGVAAADVAFAMDILQLPRCHIVAGGCFASAIALRLAVLFPEKVLSLILTGVPTPYETEPNVSSFKELASFWLMPNDADEFLQGIGGCLYFFVGENTLPIHEHDALAAIYIGRYLPSAACRAWECFQPYTQRYPLPDELLAGIRHPVMIVQGEADVAYPPRVATDLAASLTGTSPRLEFVPGGAQNFFMTHAGDLNVLILQFLTSTEFPAAEFSAPPLNLRAALEKVAMMANDPSKAQIRQPRPIDFSVVPPEQIEGNRQNLAGLAGLQQVNARMFNFPDFWQDQNDKPLPGFRYSRRHEVTT